MENGSKLTTIALAVLSWHGVIDYFVMLYFISPWRREIVGWIRRTTGKQTGGQKNQKVDSLIKGAKFSILWKPAAGVSLDFESSMFFENLCNRMREKP
ncbi:hypothetical protein M3Y99_01385100 [Aphelenchoides fujianensis]|nr:hypothetical protein M3Y99_01385100 [Aphelenchoides fujianensis]